MPGLDVGAFFDGLESRLEGARTYHAKSARLLGTRFNTFYFFQYEKQLSNILADLLKPFGSHGQEGDFLNAFLSIFERDERTKSNNAIRGLRDRIGTGRLWVQPEEFTPGGRPIDIVISCDGFGLGIENKPWAGDQTGQLRAYAEYLSRAYAKGWMLVYISGSGNPPTPDSLPQEMRLEYLQNGNYSEISYSDGLANWLNECVRACDSDKVRWFLRDFRNFAILEFSTLRLAENNHAR